MGCRRYDGKNYAGNGTSPTVYGIALILCGKVIGRPKGRAPIQDKKGYGREAGIIVLAFAAISLLASLAMLIHPFLGISLILLSIILISIQFKRIEEKYSGDGK